MAKKPVKRKTMRIHEEGASNYTTEDLLNFMEQLKSNDEAAFRRIVNVERLLENLVVWKFGQKGIEDFGKFLEELKSPKEPTEDKPK